MVGKIPNKIPGWQGKNPIKPPKMKSPGGFTRPGDSEAMFGGRGKNNPSVAN